MQVLKFGGSSVANAANINTVLDIISQKSKAGRTVAVVSAMGGITDLLLRCGECAVAGDASYRLHLKEIDRHHTEATELLVANESQKSLLDFIKLQCAEMEDICNGVFLLKELSARTKDRIMGYGELLSSKIISAALQNEYPGVQWVNAASLISTDDAYGNAAVDFAVTNKNIEDYFTNLTAELFIAPGFIASDKTGVRTTLGRGGSDYTAAIFAAALNASVLEIWTDVSGMMTADPRRVANAAIIPRISYREAMELSHFGAKVIYPPTILPVMNKGINIRIKNTFSPEAAGTLIRQYPSAEEGAAVTGISAIDKIALLSLEGSGMVGIPGIAGRLFAALAAAKINVVLITQSSSEHSICVAVNEENAQSAKRMADAAFSQEIFLQKIAPLYIEKDLSVIALVGDRMKNHTGISGKLFNALGKNGVNIRAISQGSSERNISTVVNSSDVKKAINVIHEAFFEKETKEINVFIAGAGNVGSKLLGQINNRQQYLAEKLRLKIKIAGIANSKANLIDETGIDLSDWQQRLAENGTPSNIQDYINSILQKNLRNTVFVDVTANEDVAKSYEALLEKAITVVACNKIACSSSYAYYKKLKDLATEYNAQFLFETNVGAGLPVIGTLNDLLHSGDNIHKMQAVLSGTLNFVFNNYDGSRSFAEVVKQAQDEGYTEPDPRLDLSGKDVMRKIMILARENGDVIEMDDIENNSFMPPACMEGSVEDFYLSMQKHEAHFKAIYDEAAAAGCKLKFAAAYNAGKASVGLQHIGPQHDLYHLYGKDNIVLFYTDRYPQQPLVVKGAGAGADVTASGIFADIIRTAKS